MKICYLNTLWHENKYGGGVWSYLHLLPQKLFSFGNDVTIITSGTNSDKVVNGIRVVSVGKVEVLTYKWQFFSPIFIYKRIRYIFRATSFILSENFDLVEAADGGFEHFLLVFFKKCPIITRMHGRTSGTKRIFFGKIFDAIENIAIRKSDGISIPSESYYKTIPSFILRKKIVKIIPYGIDLDFRPANLNIKKRYKLVGKKIVLSVGEVSYRKGFDTLLKIADSFKDRNEIVFVVLGAVNNKYFYEKIPPNVFILGYKPRNEVYSFLHQSDVFLSTSRFETFGIAVVEALMCGKPVVASTITGLKDLVKNGKNGYLFEVGDITEAKVNLLKILDNPERKKKMGKQSLVLAKSFTFEKVMQQTLSFYKEVVRNYENN